MSRNSLKAFSVLVLVCLLPCPVRAGEVVSLAGPWRFAIDPRGEGVVKRWFSTTLADTIRLPATTETAGKGPENAGRSTEGWTHVRFPPRLAWYRREVEIPAAWPACTSRSCWNAPSGRASGR